MVRNVTFGIALSFRFSVQTLDLIFHFDFKKSTLPKKVENVVFGTCQYKPKSPPCPPPRQCTSLWKRIDFLQKSIYLCIYLFICPCLRTYVARRSPPCSRPPMKADRFVCVCVCVLRLECVCPAVLSGKVGFGAQILTTRRKNFT